jgi:hypothetical protein
MNPIGMPLTAFNSFAVLQPKRASSDPAPTLSAAYRKRMRDDPRSDSIATLEDQAANHIKDSGWAGSLAQVFSGYLAGKEGRDLEKEYMGQQEQNNAAIAQYLSNDKSLDEPTRNLIQSNPDYAEFAVTNSLKNKLDPKESPSYQTYTGSDGQQYAWNPKNPGEQPRALPNSQKPDEFDNIETVVDGRAGIYRQNKRTGQIGDFVGALPPKAPDTVVNIDQKAEGAGRKAQAEASAAIWKDARVAAQSAYETKAAIAQFRQASNGTPQGPVSSYSLPIRSALNELGLKDDAIPNQEAMNAATASMVIADAKKLGTNPTDRDAILMERKSPALSKTPGGNAIILNYGERAADRKIQEARWMSEYLASPDSGGILGAGWDDYLAKKQEENPLLTPEERKLLESLGSQNKSATSKLPPGVTVRRLD